jgi:putative tricarboxylic transport membrane protein
LRDNDGEVVPEDMANRWSARADLATGAALFALSAAVVTGSWTMDRLEARQIHPLSAPGVTPGLLGLALAVASILLMTKAARSLRTSPVDAASPAEKREPAAALRVVTAAALCFAYALGLVGRMPFWLATSVFVASFIAALEWEPGVLAARRLAGLAWALVLGLATGIGVAYLFSDIFLVRLP